MIPNLLTVLRIILMPITISFCWQEYYVTAFICSLLAAFSDYLDGKLARALKQETKLGTMLDPIADKIYEMGLIYFLWVKDLVPIEYLGLFYFRNLVQLLVDPFLLTWKKALTQPEPKLLTKLACAWGMILINLLILNFTTNVNIFFVVFVLIVSAIFELYLLVIYLRRFITIYRGLN